MALANPNRRLRVPGADGAAASVFLYCQVGRFGFASDSPYREYRTRVSTRPWGTRAASLAKAPGAAVADVAPMFDARLWV